MWGMFMQRAREREEGGRGLLVKSSMLLAPVRERIEGMLGRVGERMMDYL